MSNVFDSMISKNGHHQNRTSAKSQDMDTSDPSGSKPEENPNPDSAPRTPREVREATQELLRYGYIEESRKSEFFRKAVVHRKAIGAALEPLDLAMQLDSHRGVAFLKVAEPENNDPKDGHAWSHPLVRRQRLTLEQSLLVAILRQGFVVHEQESGVGENPARVAVEDLLPQFLTYFEDSGSDAKNESRLLNLLDQLKTHGIVSEVDKKQEVTIRPMIAHLANPDSLTALLQTLQQQTTSEKQRAGAAAGHSEAEDHE